MEEEVRRFALLEETIGDFIEKQTTRAKTDRNVSLLKPFLQWKVELTY